MKEIKTGQTVKNIRMLDRAACAAGRMKNAYVRTREQAEQTQQTNTDSPVGYAEDRVTKSAREMSSKAVDVLQNQRKRLEEKIQQKVKKVNERKKTSGPEQSQGKARYPKTEQQKATTTNASAFQYEPYVAESNTPSFATQGLFFVQEENLIGKFMI